jgi:hypothetical protein
MRERENGFGLSLRVGVENIGLDITFVLEHPIEDVDRFPDTAGNEVAEQSYVGIGDQYTRSPLKTLPHCPKRQQRPSYDAGKLRGHFFL